MGHNIENEINLRDISGGRREKLKESLITLTVDPNCCTNEESGCTRGMKRRVFFNKLMHFETLSNSMELLNEGLARYRIVKFLTDRLPNCFSLFQWCYMSQ